MPSLANSPALFNLARKCKGCPDTLCKGCHETGQKPGLPGTPTDAAKAPQDGSDESAMSSRTPPTHTSPSADWLRSRVLMLLDFIACGYESRVYSVFQRTANARLLGAGEKQPAFLLIVYILYGQVVYLLRRIYSQCFEMVRLFETRLAGLSDQPISRCLRSTSQDAENRSAAEPQPKKPPNAENL